MPTTIQQPQGWWFQIKERLGVTYLATQWKYLLTPKYVKEDATAAVTVAALALPLSLAVAIASGVPAHVGLTSAIVGGLVCSVLGGNSLGISSSAAAMSVIVQTVILKFGMPGIIAVTCMAGVLQMITGILRVGKYIRFVPAPVIDGFLAGIGALITVTQLPKALGIKLPPVPQGEEPKLINILGDVWHQLAETNVAALGLSAMTLAIILILPRFVPQAKSFAPMIGITLSTILNFAFVLGAPTIGALPTTLPTPAMPMTFSDIPLLLGSAIVTYSACSLECLLSAVATDKAMIARNAKSLVPVERHFNQRHNSDQELLGQGFANVVVSFFGGIPITGVVARSTTNVHVGAITRRATMLHTIVLFSAIASMAPVLAHVPVCALSGFLFSVALGMMDPKHLKRLHSISPIESIPFICTAFGIVGTSLITGIEIGIASQVALLLAVQKHKKFDYTVVETETNAYTISFTGAVNFLSVLRIQELLKELQQNFEHQDKKPLIYISFKDVSLVDYSGAEELKDIFDFLDEVASNYYLLNLSAQSKRALVASRSKIETHF